MSFYPGNCLFVNAWQQQVNTVGIQESKQSVDFRVDFRLKFKYQWLLHMEGGDSTILQEIDGLMVVKSFLVKSRHLTSDFTSRWIISQMLSQMYIPLELQGDMIQYISSCACAMAEADFNVGRMTLPMVVDIMVLEFVPYDEDDMITLASSNSMDIDDEDGVSRTVPATRSSIEALEKVKFDGWDSDLGCMICLEGFSIGSQVTCMPCSHVFHGGCIVQWLEKSNLCPLCRFEMPS